MTEQEYINVKEITIIRDVLRLLSDITPQISDVIPVSGFENITKELSRWETNLSERIKTKP